MSSELAIATYNIQNSRNSLAIQENVYELCSQTDITCLQEFTGQPQLVEDKNHIEWISDFNDDRYGLVTVWSEKLEHIKSEQILLPQLNSSLPLWEKIIFLPEHELKKMRRGALISSFEWEGCSLRVTNVHLDAPGGMQHRSRQLAPILEYLTNNPTDCEILCGDFNTGSEKQLQSFLGEEFKNVSSSTSYTSDLVASIETDLPVAVFKQAVKLFGLHLRQKLDHIFVKGFDLVDVRRIDKDGSDHYPLLATLKRVG